MRRNAEPSIVSEEEKEQSTLPREDEENILWGLFHTTHHHGARIEELEREMRKLRLRPQTQVQFTRSVPTPSHLDRQAREVLKKAHAADNPDDRLGAIIRLKEILTKAIQEARRWGPRIYKHGLITVRQSLDNTYAEDLSHEQFEALESALQILEKPDLDEQEVRTMARCLRQTGLRSIPALTDDQREQALESLGL